MRIAILGLAAGVAFGYSGYAALAAPPEPATPPAMSSANKAVEDA
jgi:hypothetical protein